MILVYHSTDSIAMRHDGGEYNMCSRLLADFDADNGKYEAVADVESDDLEVAFDSTNHISDSWTKNENVTTYHDKPVRSTSVGDIFVARDGIYLVAPFGFDLLRKFDI